MTAPPGIDSAGQIELAYSGDFNSVVLIGLRAGRLAAWQLADTGWTAVADPGPPFDPGTIGTQAFTDVDGRGVVVLAWSDLGRSAHIWRVDRTGWSQLQTPVPMPPRGGAGLFYDTASRLVYMYGGGGGMVGASRGPDVYYNDLWVWDGSAWRQQRAPERAPTADAILIPSGSPNRPLLFGGFSAGHHPSDAWRWTGQTWESAPNPIGAISTTSYATDDGGHSVIVGVGVETATGFQAAPSWYTCSAGTCEEHAITDNDPPAGGGWVAYDRSTDSFVLVEDPPGKKLSPSLQVWRYSLGGHWQRL